MKIHRAIIIDEIEYTLRDNPRGGYSVQLFNVVTQKLIRITRRTTWSGALTVYKQLTNPK